MAFPALPQSWQLRSRSLELPHHNSSLQRPLVMGIVNVTPDSFSDGGRHTTVEQAVQHGLKLVADGADVLDVGGESTRPYSSPVPLDEELRRVNDVVRCLAAESGVPVSVDTSKASVAIRALEHGAEIINDVTGLEGDPDMISVARESGAGICAMHMQGTPQTMQDNPSYDDVVADVHAYLLARRDSLVRHGIALEKICLDPGIGFGKTHAHNRELMAHAERFLNLGTPILIGHSRKGFIGQTIKNALGRKGTQDEIDTATAQAACGLAAAGIQIVRVHDVGRVRAALAMSATMQI